MIYTVQRCSNFAEYPVLYAGGNAREAMLVAAQYGDVRVTLWDKGEKYTVAKAKATAGAAS